MLSTLNSFTLLPFVHCMFYAQKMKQEQPPESKGNLNATPSQTTLGALGDRHSTDGGATPAQLEEGRKALLRGLIQQHRLAVFNWKSACPIALCELPQPCSFLSTRIGVWTLTPTRETLRR